MARQSKGRQCGYAAGYPAHEAMEADLVALEALSTDGLRCEWSRRFGSKPPPLRSPGLLRQVLAWKIQEAAFGSLDAETRRTLVGIATALERDGAYEPKVRRGLKPGVVLTREWRGVVHRVTVTTMGFEHLGKQHASLSDVARRITGTRWSGPRFFGLEQKAARKSSDRDRRSTAEVMS